MSDQQASPIRSVAEGAETFRFTVGGTGTSAKAVFSEYRFVSALVSIFRSHR